MSTVLQHKRSSVLGHIPSTSDLVLGEIAINTRDGKAFLKRDVDGAESIIEIGAYDVTAAADLVTNNVYTGDGTTLTFGELDSVPASVNHCVVTLNGVVLEPTTDYTVDGAYITFISAPANNDSIEVRVFSFVVKSVNLIDYGFFEYDITTTTNTVSGLDRKGDSLIVDPTQVSVYLNGIKLKINTDFTATDYVITFTSNLVSGDYVEVHSYSKLVPSDLTGSTFTRIDFASNASNSSNVISSSVAGAQPVDTFLASEYRSAKYFVQVTSGTDYHATEILLIHNGTTVYITEYGSIFDNVELATFDADIASGYVRLLVTPTNTGSSIRVYRTALRI